MDTQAILSQLSNAVVALIILVLGGFGAFAVAYFKFLPEKMRVQLDEYKANQEQDRKQELNEAALAIEKARTDNLRDTAASTVFQDIGKGYLQTVPILQKTSEILDGIMGGQTEMKDGLKDIAKTLEPLPTMAEKVDKILADTQELKESIAELRSAPHLTKDKIKQIDDLIDAMSGLMLQFNQTIAEAKADLLAEKEHISRPIPTITIEKPNGKEQ